MIKKLWYECFIMEYLQSDHTAYRFNDTSFLLERNDNFKFSSPKIWISVAMCV